MRCLLLLLLLLQLQPLLRGGAERPREQAPVFWLTQQGPLEETEPGNATASPCEGLPAAGVAAWTLANRSLELLPRCLPRELQTLDASHNLLRALGAADLGHLPQLRVLSLRHNRVEALSWGPGEPAALHTLDLADNRLVELPSCGGPAARSGLRTLSLAGNPLRALRPGAFSCFPALRLLNLSSTALGRGARGDLPDGAFTAAGGAALAALEVLDLSGTFLEQIRSGWTRDLPKLTYLYLRKMPRLSSLEGGIFQMTPNLRQLDCQDSPALSSVHTKIFQDTPQLQVLQFQNCNLTSFPPWTLHSSQVLSIHLFGNPLTCSCELSWLLVDRKSTVVSRPADTLCAPADGTNPGGTFSTPLALSQLPGVCQAEQSTTPRDASLPSVGSSTHAPAANILSAPPGPTRQNGTKPPTVAADAHKDARELAVGSPTPWTTGPSTPHLPFGGPAVTERQELATQLGPNLSAATGPTASKRPKPGNSRRTRRPPPAPAQTPSAGGIGVLLLDGDASEVGEGTAAEVRGPALAAACDYQPCKHLQTPCAELQRRLRCRCPGLSGDDAPPEPPKLLGVSEIRDTSALLSWCAPNSVVRAYEIRLYRDDGNQSWAVEGIYATARQHPLYGLAPGTAYRVCVLAANRAGRSPLQAVDASGACGAFRTQPSWPLLLAGLAAASGLLLLSTLVLSVCLCRRARAPGPRRCDTHLVAYKNPAFDYPLRLQTWN
ncbi:leucine-rich repeat neuronal protein 4 [Sorex fumeus]|uniref:leucine-rich repeat neuronal protein 4 n=1 Tax=Sorex fumeus TaxID=62283 RepID=UPI0024AD34C4|nr:leucine-rich repeat neuronal protein 4 [Sorex fumeus]